MIIVDFNGVVVGQILSQKDFSEDMMRHQILNTLRMYNEKFKKQYGKMFIALEGGSWRRDIFPEYKHKRRETKKDNQEQFDQMFEFLNKMQDELRENMPFPLIQVRGAEADDIIAQLCHHTQQFGQYEDVMIISADKDFAQLQKYSNVKQFSPMAKRMIVESDPERFIFDHILKGDTSDGVPNILSGDNTFTEGLRQTPLRQKKIDELWDQGLSILTEEEKRNYHRNKMMISLDEIPLNIRDAIMLEYDAVRDHTVGKMKTMNYLINKKCKLLVGSVDEFY